MRYRLFSLFFCILFLGKAIAAPDTLLENYEAIEDELNTNIDTSIEFSHSAYHLNQVKETLKAKQTTINSCLKQEKKVLNDLNANTHLLNLNTTAPVFLGGLPNKKESYEAQINIHQNYLQYCEYLDQKLKNASININILNYENYKQQLSKRVPNLIQTLKLFSIASLSLLNPTLVNFKAYLLNISLANYALRPILILMLAMIFFRGLSCLNLGKFLPFNLSMTQIFFSVGLVLLTDPFFLNALNYDYSNNYVYPLEMFQKMNLHNLIPVFILYHFLSSLGSKKIARDLLLLALSTIILSGLIFISFNIYYLNSKPSTSEILGLILVFKYLFLLLYSALIILCFCFVKHYVFPSLTNHNQFNQLLKYFLNINPSFLLSIIMVLLFLGCLGYVNLVIHILFFTNIFLLVLLWFQIFIHVVNQLIAALNNPNSLIGKKVHELLYTGQNQQFFELAILRVVWIFGFLFFFSWTMWQLALLPSSVLFNIYAIFFESITPFKNQLVFFNVLWALAVLMFLNIINRFTTQHFAKRLSSNLANLEKKQKGIYITGIVVCILISIKLSQINFENIEFIIGAISFGLGIGLRDLVGNFIAGLILIFASPLEKNQYIIISEARGFIQKISLMNTEIESFDKVILTIPNLKILGSVVQNLSISKKAPPRFHFIFIFSNIEKLDTYKKLILEILSKEANVIMLGQFDPEFFILPTNNPGELELNLSFSIKNIQNVWQTISNLTLYFTQSFNHKKLDIQLRSNNLQNI